MSTQAAIPSLAASCAGLLLAACGGGGGATASNPDPPTGEGAPPASSQGRPPSEGRPPSPSPPRADTATEQRARSTGIVSRANSLIASPWSVQRGSAPVTHYQPSCTGTTCTFTNQHHITLSQSSWSSADKKTPHPSEKLNFVMFRAWMDHSVFFTATSRGQFSDAAYNSNLTMAGGQLSGLRPPGNATWQGLMVGTPVTGTGRGHRLRGDASLRLTSQVLDADFTNIYNLDRQAVHSVPAVVFTRVPVDGQGQFEDGPRGRVRQPSLSPRRLLRSQSWGNSRRLQGFQHRWSLRRQAAVRLLHGGRECPTKPMFTMRVGSVMQGTHLKYREWAIAST